MAKDKKSFLFYTDWHEIFKELSDKDAGKLIKHLTSYVNDENPQEPTGAVKMAWIPIKQQLKRDLKKWEEIIDKRSEAGKISAEKRKQSSTKSTSVESVELKSTKSTVKEEVTVTDNDTVTVIEIKRDWPLSFPFESEIFKASWEDWRKYLAEIRKPYNSRSAEQAALQFLGGFTEAKAIGIISHCMKNQWKNLREIETKNYGKNNQALPTGQGCGSF